MSSLTLKEEKEKIEFEKKLEWKNIFREKLFLGLIVAGFSVYGAWLLEDFKSDQVRKQFMTVKRLEAVTEIRDSYIEMNIAFAKETGLLKRILKSKINNPFLQSGDSYWISYFEKKKNDEINKCKNDYLDSIRDFKHKELRHGALVSDDFENHLSYQSSIHIAVYRTNLYKLLDYKMFIIDMAEHFDVHCKRETGIISDLPKGAYYCEPWSANLLMRKGYNQFLIEQVENWKEWKKIHPQIYEKITFYPNINKLPTTIGP